VGSFLRGFQDSVLGLGDALGGGVTGFLGLLGAFGGVDLGG